MISGELPAIEHMVLPAEKTRKQYTRITYCLFRSSAPINVDSMNVRLLMNYPLLFMVILISGALHFELA